MQQPGGEDMTALAIGAKLDFVDREKLDLAGLSGIDLTGAGQNKTGSAAGFFLSPVISATARAPLSLTTRS